MGRTPKTPKAPGPPRPSKKKSAPKAVPDKPIIVHLHKLDANANRKVFGESAAALRQHVNTAMEQPACAWLSENVSEMMNALSSNAANDKAKIAKHNMCSKNLVTGGWSVRMWGSNGEWTFTRGEIALSPAKVEKAIKPAQAVANLFFALGDTVGTNVAAEDLEGGGSDEDEVQNVPPRRGAREDEFLPFENPDFENFLGADNEVPGFVTGVTNGTLRADQHLDQRATDFGRGLTQPADHRLASGDRGGFRLTFNCKTHDISEGRVLQEDVVTGTMFSVKVGAPRNSMSRKIFDYFSTAHMIITIHLCTAPLCICVHETLVRCQSARHHQLLSHKTCVLK